MNIAIYMSQTRREERLVSALVAGFRRHGVVVAATVKPADPKVYPGTADLVVFIGVKSRKVRNACVAAGVPYLLIDKGYFNRSRYHRFCLNGFTPCYLGSGRADPERFNRLGIRLTNVRKPSASLVTFVKFDNKYAAFHGIEDADDYAVNVNSKIKSIIEGTSLKLLVRSRSDRVKMPFSALLPQCYCAVAHGSIAAVEALMAGVPVVSLGGMGVNVVHDLSNDKLESVVNPTLPDPVRVSRRLAELAWCQFNIEEIGQGLAWATVSEHYKGLR